MPIAASSKSRCELLPGFSMVKGAHAAGPEDVITVRYRAHLTTNVTTGSSRNRDLSSLILTRGRRRGRSRTGRRGTGPGTAGRAAAVYAHRVADFLTPDAFCDGAQEFARSALEAHHARRFRRLAVDAATCLEHLAKACLAKRSPALLTELRGEANYPSLLLLLGIAEGKPRRQLRTVGLRDALERVKVFVQSRAPDTDLRTLVC
jgi:hypothetical protein